MQRYQPGVFLRSRFHLFLFAQPFQIHQVGLETVASQLFSDLSWDAQRYSQSSPERRYLGWMLGWDRPFPQSEVEGLLEQIFIKRVSVHRYIHLSLYPDNSPSSWWLKHSQAPPCHDAANTMLQCQDAAKQFCNLFLFILENFIFRHKRVLLADFGRWAAIWLLLRGWGALLLRLLMPFSEHSN